MPTLLPRDITIPEPGSDTATKVLSLTIRRALKDLMRLTASARVPALREFKPCLQQLLRDNPGALASSLRSPTIGGLLRCLRFWARPVSIDFEAGVTELLATLLTDLAHADALSRPLSLRRLPPRVVSMAAAREFVFPEGAHSAVFSRATVRMLLPDGEELEIDLREPDSAPSYFKISPSLALATIDNNPLSMFEAHPDKEGNQLDLGGRPASEWVEIIQRSLELIGRHMPELRAELDLFVRQIVPVGFDTHRHLSASYQEIIGTVYMTLHPQLMTMVEAIIHEFQHNKLHALLELDPLLDNAFHPLYPSPVRPDPRPLQGVLLAVHAFQPVALLYERMREAGAPLSRHPEFERRFQEIIAGNAEAAEVLLEHGQATPTGRAVLDEIERWRDHAW